MICDAWKARPTPTTCSWSSRSPVRTVRPAGHSCSYTALRPRGRTPPRSKGWIARDPVHTERREAGVDDDDRLVVELEGDLDVVSAGPVGDQLCSLVEDGELIIEVDCRAVTFIESRGLAM